MSEHVDNAVETVEDSEGTQRKYGVRILLEPQNETHTMHKVRSVLAVLKRLDIRPTTVLVIREGKLLTPDQRLYHGDHITVRTVVSSG